jgi:hypothetical protein
MDNNGRVIDVEIDEQNQKPAIQPLFSTVDQSNHTLAEAVVQRKVYVSNLGGRVIDDKRIFHLISKGLAPVYSATARPPGIIDHRDDYLSGTDDHHYVVKEPNKSGGDGIYLLAQLSAEERRVIKSRVAEHPDDFIVQRFANLTSTLSISSDGAYRPRIVDWGVFVFFDSDGEVRSSARAILPRVANDGSVSTNTSQGAGYGLAVITSTAEHSKADRVHRPRLAPRSQMIALNTLINNLWNHSPDRSDHWYSEVQRQLTGCLPFLGRRYSPFLARLIDVHHQASFDQPRAEEIVNELRSMLASDSSLIGWRRIHGR